MIFNLDNYRREAEIPIQRGISATFQRPFVSSSLRLFVSPSLRLSVSQSLFPFALASSRPHILTIPKHNNSLNAIAYIHLGIHIIENVLHCLQAYAQGISYFLV